MIARIKLGIAKFFFYLIGYTPLPILHFLGATLGSILFFLPIKPRYYVWRNIEICFPHLSAWQRQWLLFRALREVMKGAIEAPVFWVRSQSALLKMVKDYSPLHGLRTDIAAGKGAIIIGTHMGGYYLQKPILDQDAYNNKYMYRPQRGLIGEIMQPLVQDFVGQLVTTSKEGVLALFRHLKNRGSVGLTCDHNVLDFGNIWVPFFGYDVPTMTLAAKLAHKTQAPVYFTMIERLSWGRGYRLQVWPVSPAIYDPDERVAVRAMNQEIETAIRRFPTQHEWLYRRFWDRPNNERPLYKTQYKKWFKNQQVK